MRKCLRWLVITLAALVTPVLFADSLPIGVLSLDQAASPDLVTFDLANQTGINDSTFPDITYPVATALTIVDFSLELNFVGGGSVTELPSQFISDGSGGFSGNFTLDLSVFPLQSAFLSGTVDQDRVLLNDGVTMVSIEPSFSAFLLPGLESSLQPGDATVFNVTETPEPGSWMLLAVGSLVLLGVGVGGRHEQV